MLVVDCVLPEPFLGGLKLSPYFWDLRHVKPIRYVTFPTSTGVGFLSSTVNLSGHWTKPLPFDSRYRYFKIHGFCLVPDRCVKALFVATCLEFQLVFPSQKKMSFWKQYNYQYWFLILKQWYYLEKIFSPPLLTVCCYFLGGLRLVKHHQLFTSDQLTKTDSFVAILLLGMLLKHVDQRMLMYFEVDLPMLLIHLFIIDMYRYWCTRHGCYLL